MLVYLLAAALAILIAIVVSLLVIIRNLLLKIDIYEKWILDFKEHVNRTYTLMRGIDTQGTFATRVNEEGIFESDDQVGQIFQELLDLINKLNEKTGNSNETEEE